MRILTLDRNNDDAPLKVIDQSSDKDFNCGIGTDHENINFNFSGDNQTVFIDVSKHDAKFLRDRLNEMKLD